MHLVLLRLQAHTANDDRAYVDHVIMMQRCPIVILDSQCFEVSKDTRPSGRFGACAIADLQP